ncbi:MAG: hypothetical protein V4625_15645 [Pseudomonadota bacterium]
MTTFSLIQAISGLAFIFIAVFDALETDEDANSNKRGWYGCSRQTRIVLSLLSAALGIWLLLESLGVATLTR